jgi:hypothetical protein
MMPLSGSVAEAHLIYKNGSKALFAEVGEGGNGGSREETTWMER